jgi:hypothetical protein
MKQSHALKLPYRANKVVPEEVRRLIPAQDGFAPETSTFPGVKKLTGR